MEPGTILVYSEQVTNRLLYAARLIFRDILQVPVSITSRESEFLAYPGVRINYSGKLLTHSVRITPHGLLTETGIREIDSVFDNTGDIPLLFPSSGNDDTGFDILAASFYLATRYEEYNDFEADRYGRFPATASCLYQNDCLQRPIINEWVQMLQEQIEGSFPFYHFPPRQFRFLPTVDADNTWAYLHKNVLRNIGGAILDMIKPEGRSIKNRIRTLLGKAPDPFDSYEWLYGIHKDYGIKPKWFILTGNHSRYDTNVNPMHPAMKRLLQDCRCHGELGFHPSFAAADDPDRLKKEFLRLENLSEGKIRISRQHFLRLTFPVTYRNLLSLGIMEDYSLGYPSEPGFRAGICTPFYFYDLPWEQETPLLLVPFQVMDRTFLDYHPLPHHQALDLIKVLMNRVKQVNGLFVSIFHNETLQEYGPMAGWREVYRKMNDFAVHE